MKSRALNRIRLFLLLVFATANCGEPGGPKPHEPGRPTVTPNGNSTVLTGEPYQLSVTFSDTTANGSPWTYSINWGDGATSNGTKTSLTPIAESHTYAAEGSYEAQITVTNSAGKSGDASLTITVAPPVILAAGDIADCTRPGDDSTALLLDTLEGVVVALGDNAYLNGTLDDYNNCYAPTWGRHKARTRPVPGNHDYNTPDATGYYGYFGAAAGDPAKGYYNFTLGSWLVIVINTGTDVPSNYEAGSPQEQWLRGVLAASSQQCVLAMMHHPRFSTVKDRSPITYYTEAIWNALYEYGADLVLTGHDHTYQRYAPQKPDGTRDDAFGIRQITNGAGGGETLYSWADPVPTGSNIEVRNNTTHGVLKVTLRSGGYDWKFVPSSGASFTDAGSGNCHGRPS